MSTNTSLASSPSIMREDGGITRTGIVWQALARKTASATSSSALLWGAINFVICAILVACLDVEPVSESVVVWWCCVAGCGVCSINILTHLWCYLYPVLLLPPVLVSGKQQQLLSLADNECSPRPPVDSKTSLTTPVKSAIFSSILQQSLRTPSPADLSTTLHNTSALSWASYGSLPGTTQSWGSVTPCVNTSWLSGCADTSSATGVVATSAACGGGSCGSCCPNTSASPHLYMSTPHHLHCSTSFNSSGMCSNSSLLGSPNISSTATSWSFLPQYPSPCSPSLRAPTSSPITTRRQLDAYITEYQQQCANVASVLERCSSGGGGGGCSSGGGGGGLWCYSNSGCQQHNLSDSVLMLRRNTYQKATRDPVVSSGSGAGGADPIKNAASAAGASQAGKVWARRGVTARQLFQFEENLRIWLCGAVVQPLVKKIDETNRALADIAPDLQIGVVGVEKLRKACSSSCSAGTSSLLSGLVPFLERAPAHQHYLLTRLRELAKGGALSAYTWNKGGAGWTDQCPADALLLVDLFALYLDSQLPPDPSQSEGRVFSSQYVVTAPDKPPQQPDHAVLHITQLSPPHVRVLLPGEDECEVGEGPKNAFHCVLLFLHHLVHTRHCCLAGVNLALTGVNLAWVVTDSS